MRSILQRGWLSGWTRVARLALAAPGSAWQLAGDLLSRDAEASGVCDGAGVRVTCRDTPGTVCFDSTATTGALHEDVPAAAFRHQRRRARQSSPISENSSTTFGGFGSPANSR